MKKVMNMLLAAGMIGTLTQPVSAEGPATQQRQPGSIQQPGGSVVSASSPTEIVTSDLECTAEALTADEENAAAYTMSDENNTVKIDSAGTYIVTGTCADGTVTVKKNTEGVVLILRDLTLTSTLGAPVSLNKYSQVKVIIEGNVTLTDDEDPALEDVSDDYDGAALKAKDGSDVYLTGSGKLTLNGNAKNGLKVGDADEPCFVIDGSLTIDINAANDGINAGYDFTILSGTIVISSEDDGIHADRILTIGNDGSGPEITISDSYEAMEGTIVNLFGGSGTLKASDDGINAANGDGTFEDVLTYSINITGGSWTVNSTGDGLDSNGNINITGGYTVINSASNGGEAGLDYEGSLYVAEGTLKNGSGVSFDSGQNQQPGGTQPGQQPGGTQPGQQPGQQPGGTQPDSGESEQAEAETVSMYRLYNPNSGEHFYTGDAAEKDALVKLGWSYEGIGWTAPASGNTPVYRLYNANAGDHHYTVSLAEKDALVKLGWTYEGIGWYSDEKKGTAVYREYNPNAYANNHNYTSNQKEHEALVNQFGWNDEGIAWYGI